MFCGRFLHPISSFAIGLFIQFLSLSAVYAQQGTTPATEKVKVVKYDALHTYIQEEVEEIRVINFWATWCAPCIKEMPFFEALPQKWGNTPLKVLYVSMDFPEEANGKVLRFLENKGIKKEVWLLDETDFNAFIDRVDPSWSGAIPATLIIGPKKKTRKFLERELHKGDLEAVLSALF
jgi:thiol-disulfide isomerase/thioredoxin